MSIKNCIKGSKFKIEPNKEAVLKFISDKFDTLNAKAKENDISLNTSVIDISKLEAFNANTSVLTIQEQLINNILEENDVIEEISYPGAEELQNESVSQQPKNNTLLDSLGDRINDKNRFAPSSENELIVEEIEKIKEVIRTLKDTITVETRESYPGISEKLEDLKLTKLGDEADRREYNRLLDIVKSIHSTDRNVRELRKKIDNFKVLESSIAHIESSKDERDQIVDNIFNLEYELLTSSAHIKEVSLEPLDQSMDELKAATELIDSKNNITKGIQSFADPNFQRASYMSGTSGKTGIGVFSLLLTFNSIIQGHNTYDRTKSHESFSINGTKFNPNLSNPYTSKTLTRLEKIFSNKKDGLFGKFVIRNKATGEYSLRQINSGLQLQIAADTLAKKFNIPYKIVSQEHMKNYLDEQGDPLGSIHLSYTRSIEEYRGLITDRLDVINQSNPDNKAALIEELKLIYPSVEYDTSYSYDGGNKYYSINEPSLKALIDKKTREHWYREEKEQADQLGLTVEEYRKYNDLSMDLDGVVAGVYDGKQVMLVADAKIGTVYHEFAHPLINDLTKLFDSSDLKQAKEARRVYDRLLTESRLFLKEDAIKDVYDSYARAYNLDLANLTIAEEIKLESELIVRGIEKIITNQKSYAKGKGLINAVKNLINFIKDHISTRLAKKLVFNKTITAADLNEFVSLETLSNIISVAPNKIATTGGHSQDIIDSINQEREIVGSRVQNRQLAKLKFELADAIKKGVDTDSVGNYTTLIQTLKEKVRKSSQIVDNMSITDDTEQIVSDWYNFDSFSSTLSETIAKEVRPDLFEDFDFRKKSYFIKGYQSASVDNANEKILDAGFINGDTFNFVTIALSMGMEFEEIQFILQNKTIQDYHNRINIVNTIGKPYTPDADFEVLNNILSDLLGINERLANPDIKYTREDAIQELEQFKSDLDEKTHVDFTYKNITSDQKTAELLYKYYKFNEANKSFSKYVNLLNSDKKGGGKDFLTINNTVSDVEQLQDSASGNDPYKLYSLLNDSIIAPSLDNLYNNYQLFKHHDINIYNRVDNLFNNVYSELKGIVSVDFNKSNQKTKFEEDLGSNLSSSIWNKALESYENSDNLAWKRYDILVDSNDRDNPNTSLGTIISNIQLGKYFTGDIETDTSLAYLKDLSFIKRMVVEGVKNHKSIKTISINNNKSKDFDDTTIQNTVQQIYNQDKYLFTENGRRYTTKTLITELVRYTILTGAGQTTRSLNNLLPAPLLLTYAQHLKDYTYTASTSKAYGDTDLSDVAKDFIFNNPGYLPKIVSKFYDKVADDKKTIALKTKKYGKEPPKYVTISAQPDMVYALTASPDGKVLYTQVGQFRYKNLIRQYGTPSESLFTGKAFVPDVFDFMKAGEPKSANLTPHKNVSDALNSIKNNDAIDDDTRTIIENIYDKVKNVNLVYGTEDEIKGRGIYDAVTNTLSINKETTTDATFIRILLHELGHALTFHKLIQFNISHNNIFNLSNYEFVRDNITLDPLTDEDITIIQSLYVSYQQYTEFFNDPTNKVQGERMELVNFFEFVAEIIGNPDVRANIDKVAQGNSSFKALIAKVYNNLVKLVSKIFFTDPIQESASQQIVSNILFLSDSNIISATDNRTGVSINFTQVNGVIVTATKDGETLVNPEAAYTNIIGGEDVTVTYDADKVKNNDIDLQENESEDFDASMFVDPNTLSDDTIGMNGPKLDINDPKSGLNSNLLSVPLSNPFSNTKSEYDSIIKALNRNSIETAGYTYPELVKIINSRLIKLLHTKREIQGQLRNRSSAKLLENLENVNRQIESVAIDLNEIVEASDINQAIEIMTSQMNKLTRLLEGPQHPSSEQLVYANKVIDKFDELIRGDTIRIETKNIKGITPTEYGDIISRLNELNEEFGTKFIPLVQAKTKKQIIRLFRERTGKTDINIDEIKNDLNWVESFTLSIDRTNEELLSLYGAVKQKTVIDANELFSERLIELDESYEDAIPILKQFMSPGSKYGIHNLFIEDGKLVQELSQAYYDKSRKSKLAFKQSLNKYKEAYQEYNNSTKSPADKKTYQAAIARYKKAKANRDKILEELYITLDPRKIVPLNGSAPNQLAEDNYRNILGEQMYNKKKQELIDNIDKYNEDYKSLEEYLNQSDKSADEIVDTLNRFRFNNDPYIYAESIFANKIEFKVGDEIITPSFSYSTRVVRKNNQGVDTGYYNPTMDIIKGNEKLLRYYTATKEVYRDAKEILNDDYINLSDIPFFEKHVMESTMSEMLKDKRKTVSDIYGEIIDTFTERELNPSQLREIESDELRVNVVKNNLQKLNDIVNSRLNAHYIAKGIPLSSINDYKDLEFVQNKNLAEDEFYYFTVRDNIKNDVSAELEDFKSFDLLKISKLYLKSVMDFAAKQNTVDDMALIRDAAHSKLSSTSGSLKKTKGLNTGQTEVATNKVDLLEKDHLTYQGYSARNPIIPLKSAGKHHNKFERYLLKQYEGTLASITSQMGVISTKLANTSDQASQEDLEKQLFDLQNLEIFYKAEIDSLGGYLYVGNLLTKGLNKLTVLTMLGWNVMSYIPNVYAGWVNNMILAADGRVFSKDTYDKVSKQIYFKSTLTNAGAGIISGIALNTIFPVAGLAVGIAAGSAIASMFTKNNPYTTKILNIVRNKDILQKVQDEMNKPTRSGTARFNFKYLKENPLLSPLYNLLTKPYSIIDNGELLHQATVIGSVLEEQQVIINGEQVTLLSLADVNGKYPSMTIKHPVTGLDIELSEYVSEKVASSIALIARTHGNYRQDFKPKLKYSDIGSLAATFKTWMIESWNTRWESDKRDFNIQAKDDATLRVKGTYVSVLEHSGEAAVALGFLSKSAARATFLGLITGSPLVALGTIAIMGGIYGGARLYSKSTGKDININKNPEVNKALLTNLAYKVARNVPGMNKLLGDRIKGNEEIFNKLLNEVDAANYRKFLQEQAISVMIMMMYISFYAAKEAVGDDDEYAKKVSYLAVNMTGRMMLDIDSYTSPSDASSKVEQLDRIVPAIKMGKNLGKFAKHFIYGDEYLRKTGKYDKGDKKFWKDLMNISPLFKGISGTQKVLEQEYQIFKKAK